MLIILGKPGVNVCEGQPPFQDVAQQLAALRLAVRELRATAVGAANLGDALGAEPASTKAVRWFADHLDRLMSAHGIPKYEERPTMAWMTVADFRSLSDRDWENGAVREEIYNALVLLESTRQRVKRFADEIRDMLDESLTADRIKELTRILRGDVFLSQT